MISTRKNAKTVRHSVVVDDRPVKGAGPSISGVCHRTCFYQAGGFH